MLLCRKLGYCSQRGSLYHHLRIHSSQYSSPGLQKCTTNFGLLQLCSISTTTHSEEDGVEEKPMQEFRIPKKSGNGRIACVNGLKKNVDKSTVTSSQSSFELQTMLLSFIAYGKLMWYLSPCFGSTKEWPLSFPNNASHGDKAGFSNLCASILHWIGGDAIAERSVLQVRRAKVQIIN